MRSSPDGVAGQRRRGGNRRFLATGRQGERRARLWAVGPSCFAWGSVPFDRKKCLAGGFTPEAIDVRRIRSVAEGCIVGRFDFSVGSDEKEVLNGSGEDLATRYAEALRSGLHLLKDVVGNGDRCLHRRHRAGATALSEWGNGREVLPSGTSEWRLPGWGSAFRDLRMAFTQLGECLPGPPNGVYPAGGVPSGTSEWHFPSKLAAIYQATAGSAGWALGGLFLLRFAWGATTASGGANTAS